MMVQLTENDGLEAYLWRNSHLLLEMSVDDSIFMWSSWSIYEVAGREEVELKHKFESHQFISVHWKKEIIWDP